jgi:hypothetical protein
VGGLSQLTVARDGNAVSDGRIIQLPTTVIEVENETIVSVLRILSHEDDTR